MESAAEVVVRSGWKDILGTTASITTIGQFLSGMFTVRRLYNQGTVGDLSPVPFLMGCVGCALWLVYGHLRGDSTIVNCNIVGTALNFFYVLAFLRFTNGASGRSLMYRQLTTSLAFVSVILLYVNNSADVSVVAENLGLVCILVSIVCCASPLVALRQVLRSGSTEMLPFPLILSMFLVCTQWWAYGLLAGDFYMQFTNFVGSVIALIQLSLFVYFPAGGISGGGGDRDRKGLL